MCSCVHWPPPSGAAACCTISNKPPGGCTEPPPSSSRSRAPTGRRTLDPDFASGPFDFGLVVATTADGTVPVVGGACVGNDGTGGTWTAVTLASSTGGLYVNYGVTSVLLQ